MGSICFITCPIFMLTRSHIKEKNKKLRSPAHFINSIIQTGPQKDALKTVYLAELLHLSFDRPLSIHNFDSEKAKSLLLRSPVIKEARVSLVPPQTIYIDYTVRQPIAILYDLENRGIDEEGHIFPLSPFFPPKKLPEIYFNELPPPGKSYDLARSIIKLLSKAPFTIKRIDVSCAFANTYGKREIVLLLEDEILRKRAGKDEIFTFPRLLRLNTKNYESQLGNYFNLRAELLAQESRELPESPMVFPPKVIDLRLSNLAFVE